MNREDDAPYLSKIAAVARLLDATTSSLHDHRMAQRLELTSALSIVADRSYQHPGMIGWTAWHPYRMGNCPSVRTSLDRSAEAIAADLRRRLLPDARRYCLECVRAQSAARSDRDGRASRLAELETALDAPFRDGHSSDHRAPGLMIRDYDLGGPHRGGFTAEISVRSWHALLMIAALVREDNRIHQKPAAGGGGA